MTMVARLRAALAQRVGDAETPPRVAEVAAAAVSVVPGVVGAVVCVHGIRDDPTARIAVGASDDQALLLEQLEFAVGAGPGLCAAQTGCVVRAGDDLPRRWPVFTDAVHEQTDVRAVYAVPLFFGHPVLRAALVLYLRDRQALDDIDEAELGEVVAVVAGAVVDAGPLLTDQVRPVATQADADDPLARRLAVDVAIGMVMATLDIAAPDALAVLRGYAWSRHMALEPLVDQMITGRLPVTAVA